MACAALFLLQNEVNSRVGNRLANAVRFMTNNSEYIPGGNHFGGGRDYVCHQWFSADLMQNFRVFGFEPRPFARRHNHDGKARVAMWGTGLRFRHSIQYTRVVARRPAVALTTAEELFRCRWCVASRPTVHSTEPAPLIAAGRAQSDP